MTTKPEAWTPASVPIPEDGWYVVADCPTDREHGREHVTYYNAGDRIDDDGDIYRGWIGPLPETLAEAAELPPEPLADPFEVRVQIATFNAGETSEAVAKITDAIGSLVGRVSDGEVHRALTRGLDVALELADLAKRDLSALRDVLHEVE